MPELPEVETVARLVRPDVVGKAIRDVEVAWHRTLGGMSVAAFREAVVGARIASVSRRAKFVSIALERRKKPAGHVFVHLRMTGRLVVHPRGQPVEDDLEPYVRVRLVLERGVLSFVDVRKFGRFVFTSDAEGFTAHLGPEPLSDDFTESAFREALRARRRLIKPLLLDQEFVAGLGNIYVDESLHRAGLHPLRRSDRIPAAAARRLHAEIRATLTEAIAREGSSFDRFYRTPKGQPGSYQHQFQVYGRTGKPCLRCERPIRRIVVGQRGTHLCTRCQPAPRPTTISRP